MEPNTPQGTGAMTLDQGVAHIKARMAAKGATLDDQAIIHPEHPDEEADGTLDVPAGEHDHDHSALDETAENVSGDEYGTPDADPDAVNDTRPIILPDGSRITVAEARKGYLRQADFTRKTTELARERERMAAREQAAAQEFSSLYQQLASYQEAEPNWQVLAQSTSPEEFQRVQAHWQGRRVAAERAKRAADEAQFRAGEVQRQHLWDSLATGAFDPAWKNPKVLRQSLDTLTEYLADRGVPAELVGSIYLPSVIEIAEESRRYRELVKAQPKAALAVRGKPSPFLPGSKSAASPQSETIRRLNEAFSKNPSVDNAVALHRAKASWRRR